MTSKETNILLTPGPTPVPPEALRVMAEPIFYHRTPKFQEIFREVSEHLQEVFRTRRLVYTLTSSGTAAMEAAVVNFLSPGDRVVTLSCGKFGERWGHLAKAYRLDHHELSAEWGKSIPPEQLAEALKETPKAKAVFATLCETSTGILQDIESYAGLTANMGAILVVDAISGLCADRLEMDAWGVDVVASGSQKGLMIPPGLGFLAVSEKAEKMEESATLPKFYCDIGLYRKALGKKDTPFTPALTLVLALRVALARIVGEGYDQMIDRHTSLARATREGIKAMGLSLFASTPSNVLTSVKSPEGIDSKKLINVMRDELGVTVAGGQAELAGKIFRFAHLGYIGPDDIEAGFSGLEQGLSHFDVKIDAEKGVRAFRETLGVPSK